MNSSWFLLSKICKHYIGSLQQIALQNLELDANHNDKVTIIPNKSLPKPEANPKFLALRRSLDLAPKDVSTDHHLAFKENRKRISQLELTL